MTSTTADQILDCAHALIMEVGYSGFSYADIAQRVGISKPSIHHHFPTKAQLALKVVQRYRQQIRDALAAGARMVSDPALQLGGYVGYWEGCFAQSNASFCVCAMLASKRRTLPEEVKAEVAGHFASLAGWLGEVIGRGAAGGQFVLQQPAAVEAQCFLALIHGAMLSARALDDGAAFNVIARAGLARLTAPPAAR